MKSLMIDLDDTLVSFTDMFVHKANKLISREILYRHERLNVSDFTTYDLKSGFEKHWKNMNPANQTAIYNYCFTEIMKDEDLYDDIQLTNDYDKIMDIAQKYKKVGYKIVLNTKVITKEMLMAKSKFIYSNIDLFKHFDNIVLDYETGKIEPKPYYYDIMIDDSPKNIEYYLEKNKNGIVYIPRRCWNKHLEGHERIHFI